VSWNPSKESVSPKERILSVVCMNHACQKSEMYCILPRSSEERVILKIRIQKLHGEEFDLEIEGQVRHSIGEILHIAMLKDAYHVPATVLKNLRMYEII
jgi:cephalosporin hydroxylase